MAHKIRNPGGHPTTYKPEYCQKIVEYCLSEKNAGRRPTLCGFAAEVCHTSERVILRWADAHPDFAKAVEECNSLQKRVLMNQEGAMAIFLLKNNHGMKDVHTNENKNTNVTKVEAGSETRKAIAEILAKFKGGTK